MNFGILCAILSAFNFGINNTLSKKITNQIGLLNGLLYRNIFAVIFLLPFTFLLSSVFPVHIVWSYIWLTMLISFGGYIGLLFLFKALDIGKIGVVSVIIGSTSPISVVVAVLFLAESLSLQKFFYILLTLVGIFLVSINFSDLKKSQLLNITSGVPQAVATLLIWGVVFAFVIVPVRIVGPLFTALLIEVGNVIFTLAQMAFSKTKIVLPKNKLLFLSLIVGATAAFGGLFQNLAYSFSPINTVEPILRSLVIIVAVIAGAIMYRERLSRQQYFGILTIIVAVVLMNLN